MKITDIINEDGRIVKGVNTTVDVQPGETERQAAKFFGYNKDLIKKRKAKNPVQTLYNMGLAEGVNEDFGSVPPLVDLIVMAVLAKTTVDVLTGAFKTAIKTGKGLKKLNDLRKRAAQMGQSVADYAMPNESEQKTGLTGFDPETIAHLKRIKARYPHAPDELSALMKHVLDMKKDYTNKDATLDKELDSAEKDVDDVENDIKDLERRVNKLERKPVKEDRADSVVAAALEAMHRLVTSKGSRHSLGNYAFQISRAYELPISIRELERLYARTY